MFGFFEIFFAVLIFILLLNESCQKHHNSKKWKKKDRNPSLPALEVLYEWKQLEFAFDSETSRQNAINSKDFIPGNAVIIDVDVQYLSEYNFSEIFK